MDNQKPGHTTVESLKLQLALRRCPCADHRRRSRRPSPSATGACRCATSDPGAPRPIPDAHIRDCRLHWLPSTRPYNTTKQSVHGGHRARGPTISSLRPCMQHPVRLADTRRRDRTRRPWAPARAWHTALSDLPSRATALAAGALSSVFPNCNDKENSLVLRAG